MANTVMAKMAVQIAANTAEFNKALTKTSKDISSFTNNIKNTINTLGIAFGVQQIGSFTLEVTKLAGEADGVRRAFVKFKESQKLLQDLKTATGGTVSELELMKRTVQATNFGISLGSLPKLLEFAAVRAQQTGQSVDYLVDSIVTGIGRKSPLILDNLGISAVALKEKLDGVSIAEASVGQVADAVGKIAGDSLKQMGSLADTAATKMQKLAADWVNLKVKMGEVIEPVATFGIKFVTDFIAILQGTKPPLLELALAMDKFNKAQPHGEEFLKQYGELEKAAEAAGKKLVLLTDSATGLRKVMVDPRTPLSKPIEDTIKPALTLDQILESIQKRYDKLNSLARKAFEAPLKVDELPSATGSLVDPDFLKIDVKGIVSNFKVLQSELKPVVQDISDQFVDVTGLVVGGIADIANAFGEATTGNIKFGDAILRSLAGFAQQFGALLIATGIAEISFKKFKGPAMIAAGAALVALGGAIKGSIANRPNLSGGGGSGGGFNSQYASALTFSNGERLPSIILEARGASLVSVTTEQNRRDTRIRANSRRLS